jgi:hypothetical protein
MRAIIMGVIDAGVHHISSVPIVFIRGCFLLCMLPSCVPPQR